MTTGTTPKSGGNGSIRNPARGRLRCRRPDRHPSPFLRFLPLIFKLLPLSVAILTLGAGNLLTPACAAAFASNSHVLTNPYIAWSVGVRLDYAGYGDATGISLSFEVLAQEQVNGINSLRVITRKSIDADQFTWLAQDTDGNVWQVRSLDTVTGEFCEERVLYVPTSPALDQTYLLWDCYFDSVYTATDLNATVSTPLQPFGQCLVLRLEEWGDVEELSFAPGVGLVKLHFEGFENGGWHLSSASGIAVSAPPSISEHPVSTSVLAGAEASFSLVVTGTEPLTYRWQRQPAGSGTWIDLSDGTYSGTSTPILIVAGVSASMNGDQFRCIATNPHGSTTSAVATLSILVPNAVFPDDFNPGSDGWTAWAVHAPIVQADEKVLLGGIFLTMGSQPRSRIARLEGDGSLDTSFDPGANDWVYCLALQVDGGILVGGGFTSLAGQARHRIGRLNPDGSLDHSFNPAANAFVTSLAEQADGRILVSGGFTQIHGQTRNRIARLNPDGTLDAPFNPGANHTIHSMALQPDGKILVGGEFTTLAGQTRHRIGRLNPDGSLDHSFNPAANAVVYCLAVQADGRILAGGAFTTLDGQPRAGIVRLNPEGSLDNTFNPGIIHENPLNLPGAHAQVTSLAVQTDGKLIVGGEFTILGGQPRDHIGRLNADGTLDDHFNPGASGGVSSLALQPDGRLLVGGNFLVLAGENRNGIGRLLTTDPAIQSLTLDGSIITWLRGGTSPEVWRTTFEHSPNELNWTALGSGTRIASPDGQAPGWQLTGVSLPSGGAIRARGYLSSGLFNGSAWFVESFAALAAPQPDLAITESRLHDGTVSITLSFPTTPGRTHTIEHRAHLGPDASWEAWPGGPHNSGKLTVPGSAGQQYFRVRTE